MNKRLILSRLVSALFGVLILVFFWVFFRGISSSTYFSDNGELVSTLYKGLQPGQSALRRYQKQMVWVTYLDESIRKRLPQLESYLIDPALGCDVNQDYCIVEAKTTVDAIYLQFTNQEPQQLPSDTPWVGGFVDPTTGAVYDLLGRAYRIKSATKSSLPVIQVLD